MDSKTQQFLEALGSDMREQIGRLYTISINQTSALLHLARAIKDEKRLSADTHLAADMALITIDNLISQFDEGMAEMDKIACNLKNHFGGADE